ncbi:MAG: hypothetical protein K2K15_00615, partial [Anaeroplasmataceae bacterium]|nr:hypothetical protein [Anaeroplasmataceae bacterium]
GRIAQINNVHFEHILMDGVKTPFVINMFYNMGSSGGHEEYVSSTKALPVDEYTPLLGCFKFKHMECRNVGYAAGVFLGLPEAKIKKIELEDVSFSYDNNCEEGYPVMIEHNFKLKNAGIIAFNVEEISCNQVTFKGCNGEHIIQKDSA